MSTDAEDNEYRAQRIGNLERLESLGYLPYGRAFERTGRLAEIRASFAEGGTARAAGRLVALRDMGKSVFAHLQDATGRFQVYFRKDALARTGFAAFKHLDLGDHIGVEGTLFTTRTGEPTIKVAAWTLLSKALLPLPEKWHGLQDVETALPPALPRPGRESRGRAACSTGGRPSSARCAVSSPERGFQEVETPMMQPIGGRGRGAPVRDALRRAQRRHVPAHRAGAVPEAAAGGRVRQGVRAEPQFPQRGVGAARTIPSSPCWRSTRPTATCGR